MCAAPVPDSSTLLMPMATAIWLLDNTVLTFEQVGSFTGLHDIEITGLANGDVGIGIPGRDPVQHREVTAGELQKAIGDPEYHMIASRSELPTVKKRAQGPRYTPVSKRGDKPDAIAYILKHHPEVSDAQIGLLVGTTKPTIQAVRDRSHPNSANIKPRHPVDLGLCTYSELEEASRKGLKAQGKDPNQARDAVLANREAAPVEPEEPKRQAGTGFDFSNFLKRSGDSGSTS